MATTPATDLSARSWYLNWLNAAIRVAKFVVLFAIALGIYESLLATILTKKIHIVAYIVFWVFSAYIVLPRVNRRIAQLYVPDYFIGRARTSDGLLGDPINLALYGTEQDIITCLEQAGWTKAEAISIKSSFRIITASLLGKAYPSAPVSSLFLFGDKQALAFQQAVDNNPRRRHHVRLWKTPEGWHLPGGHTADWLGAATYDKNIGLSLFTGQITHKINGNVDQERDFLLASLKRSKLLQQIKLVPHFTTSYHSRSGGGDRIYTDGALPFVSIGGLSPQTFD